MNTKVEKYIEAYNDNIPLRTLAQLIPNVGGAVDSLLAWRGSKLQQDRIENLLKEFDKAIAALDSSTVQYSDFDTEEGADLLMQAMRAAMRNRSKKRIAAIADILVGKIQNLGDWNEAEEAIAAIDELSEFAILLIYESDKFKISQGEFKYTSTFHIGDIPIYHNTRIVYENSEPKFLSEVFPEQDPKYMRLIVNRLMQLGYVRDEGALRFKKDPETHFGFTTQADWLRRWIKGGRLATYL